MKRILLITALIFIFSISTFAQSDDTKRSVGLTAAIQDQQLDFLIPIWVSDRAVLAPNIGVVSAQDVGTDLSLGLVLKSYLRETVDAVPYLVFRGGAIFGIPSEGDTITDFVLGVGFGGEYFFEPKFSVGIEIQGNASISDEGSFRFGNPGNTNFNTATVLTASIYF